MPSPAEPPRPSLKFPGALPTAVIAAPALGSGPIAASRHVRRSVLRSSVALAAVLLAIPPAAARGAPDSFAPIVRRVIPAVVNIATIEAQPQAAPVPPEFRGTPFERFFQDPRGGSQRRSVGRGSGFVIDPAGFIVTNVHVVGRAAQVTVTFSDSTSLPAKVVGVDDLTDIALLKVEAGRPLPTVRFGDSDKVEQGDWVLAVGNPFGLGGTVTAGIVSARGRDIGASLFDDFLQVDAPINPGNSGGPSFNLDGEVIGVNTLIFSPSGVSVGIGFAVPSKIVAASVAELRSKGRVERGWLGVSVEEVAGDDPVPGPRRGVRIAALEPGGPAARGGLRSGDVVASVNGTATDTSRALARAVAAVAPGTEARVVLFRDRRETTLNLTVGRRPA